VNGDVSAVAKALRDFAKATPTLVVKGGVLDGKALSLKDLTALADLPSRDVLLARFAGLLASPMTTMAGLLKAIPQNFAYGLSALIDSKGGAPAPAPEASVDQETAETPAGVEEAGSPASDDDATPVAEVEEEAPVADFAPETPEASNDVAEEPAE
jgi:large subunit ribosomal protein L10